MIHRALSRACAAAAAVLAMAACDGSPTDPSRPGRYTVTFLGVPAGATGFAPRAVAAGRVVGAAPGAGSTRAFQWINGGFQVIGPAPRPGCHSEPTAARGAFTVGHTLCTSTGEPGAQPVDASGWAVGVPAPQRLFPEPYTFTGVSAGGMVVGTVNPSAHFPRGQHRAFAVVNGAATILVPEGAAGSEAAGVTDAGDVVVTAYYVCPQDAEDCAMSRVMVWNAGAWTAVPIPRNTTRTVAAAVSADGHVAGYAFGEADQAFLYDIPDDDVDPLPIIPGTRVLLAGVNSLGSGQVVGTGIRPESAARQASYGIAWGDGRQYNLSERIIGSQPGWHVSAALATDDQGWIAGTGTHAETGQDGAIVLIPVD